MVRGAGTGRSAGQLRFHSHKTLELNKNTKNNSQKIVKEMIYSQKHYLNSSQYKASLPSNQKLSTYVLSFVFFSYLIKRVVSLQGMPLKSRIGNYYIYKSLINVANLHISMPVFSLFK